MTRPETPPVPPERLAGASLLESYALAEGDEVTVTTLGTPSPVSGVVIGATSRVVIVAAEHATIRVPWAAIATIARRTPATTHPAL